VSASHPRSGRKGEKVDFKKLSASFEHSYGRESLALVAHLRDAYPEVTKPGRRTGRTLRNLCFFVWCCAREDDPALIPTLFRTAVLLWAQDDYYDNRRISTAEKDSFCAATNHALRTNSFQPVFEPSLQLGELTSLWADIADTIPRTAPEVRSYWIEKACQLNDAMAAENRAVRRARIAYEGYMSVAIHSIGMVFIWATYLAHKHVAVTALREMEPVLLQGARIVRLSNDIASYRQRKNKKNAVTLVGGSSPRVRVLGLIVEESRAFRQSVEALDVGADVRRVLLRSMEFFQEFYQRSDFDRRRVR